VRDQYGQTEHGMLIVNGWHDDVRSPIRPGSMGQPMPGFSCAVLRDDRAEPAPAGTTGRIAVDMTASALAYSTGYHGDTDTGRFSPDGRWWLTGDAGYIDADGYYFFSPRDDDVIIMAGYRIGPFDVESVLVTHHQVIEAAVIGVPDELRGQAIEAFAVLRDPGQGNEGFAAELRQLVKDKFAAHSYPRRVHFVDALPKTPAARSSGTLSASTRPHPPRRKHRRAARQGKAQPAAENKGAPNTHDRASAPAPPATRRHARLTRSARTRRRTAMISRPRIAADIACRATSGCDRLSRNGSSWAS
jgi:hypothetical protein